MNQQAAPEKKASTEPGSAWGIALVEPYTGMRNMVFPLYKRASGAGTFLQIYLGRR